MRGAPYRLQRHGNLLVARAAAGATDGRTLVLGLLVDTGASFTMLPVAAVEALGGGTEPPTETVRLVAANGIVVAPRMLLPWFSCLGRRIEEFPVIAHTLPSGSFVDGLLGMDFLRRCRAVLSVSEDEVWTTS